VEKLKWTILGDFRSRQPCVTTIEGLCWIRLSLHFDAKASADRSLRSSLLPSREAVARGARSTDPAGGSKSAKSTGRIDALAMALSLALLRAENLIQFDSVV
jgi:hypothetical protein